MSSEVLAELEELLPDRFRLPEAPSRVQATGGLPQGAARASWAAAAASLAASVAFSVEASGCSEGTLRPKGGKGPELSLLPGPRS